jgi:hypothetical protein
MGVVFPCETLWGASWTCVSEGGVKAVCVGVAVVKLASFEARTVKYRWLWCGVECAGW